MNFDHWFAQHIHLRLDAEAGGLGGGHAAVHALRRAGGGGDESPQESSEEIHWPSSNGRDAVQVPPMKARALVVMAVAAGCTIRRSAVMAWKRIRQPFAWPIIWKP